MEVLSFDDDTMGGLTLVMFGLIGYGINEAVSALEYGGQAAQVEEGAIPQSGLCLSCFTGLIGLIAFLLLVFGAYKIYKGAEFQSSKHKTKVRWGGVSLIIGFFGSLFGGMAVMSRDMTGATLEDFEALIADAAVMGAVTGIILMGGVLLLIYELGSDKQKKYIYGLIGLYAITSIGIAVVNRSIPAGDEVEMVSTVLNRLALANGLEALFSFAFAGMYYMVRENYLNQKRKDSTEVEYRTDDESLKTCPECGEKKMNIHLSGYGYCNGCGYSTDEYYQESESED